MSLIKKAADSYNQSATRRVTTIAHLAWDGLRCRRRPFNGLNQSVNIHRVATTAICRSPPSPPPPAAAAWPYDAGGDIRSSHVFHRRAASHRVSEPSTSCCRLTLRMSRLTPLNENFSVTSSMWNCAICTADWLPGVTSTGTFSAAGRLPQAGPGLTSKGCEGVVVTELTAADWSTWPSRMRARSNVDGRQAAASSSGAPFSCARRSALQMLWTPIVGSDDRWLPALRESGWPGGGRALAGRSVWWPLTYSTH
eukprot:scaffold226028_cov42-Prasinocladus_malaysianus.AAC.1